MQQGNQGPSMDAQSMEETDRYGTDLATAYSTLKT